MWKCPKCETLNNGNMCIVCGENASNTKNSLTRKKSKKGLIIISYAVILFIIIIVTFSLVFNLLVREGATETAIPIETAETTETAAAAETETSAE